MTRLLFRRIWPLVIVALATCAGVISGDDCYTGCRNARFWGANFFGSSATRYVPNICRTGGDCADGVDPVECEFKAANAVQWYLASDCTPTCSVGTCGGLFRQFNCNDYEPEWELTDKYLCKEWVNPPGG